MPASPRDQSVNSGTDDDMGSTPRWVKGFGIITVVMVLFFFILMFTRDPGGPGGHNPLRHFGGQAHSEDAYP